MVFYTTEENKSKEENLLGKHLFFRDGRKNH